jgi:hypothetical protein
MPVGSRAWLERLLDGTEPAPTEAEFQAFVAEHAQEDQWFDFKAGAWLKPSKDRGVDRIKRGLCEWMSAFANAEGGFLVLGYDQKAGRVDGAAAPVSEALPSWLAKVVSLPGLPPLRVLTTGVNGGEVVWLAVPRARNLVPWFDGREPVYSLRINDATVPMSSSLFLDLTLGRRRGVRLTPRIRSTTRIETTERRELGTMTLSELRPCLEVTNESLAFADDVRIGLVAFAPKAASAGLERVPPTLRQALIVGTTLEYTAREWHSGFEIHLFPVVRRPGSSAAARNPIDIPPFETRSEWELASLPLAHLPDTSAQANKDPETQRMTRGAVDVQAGLYVVARDSEPAWFQVSFRHNSRSQVDPAFWSRVVVEPLYGVRPRVSIDWAPLE